MYIPQKQLKNVIRYLQPNKVVVLYGPRRCGKTTLIQHVLDKKKLKALLVSGEDIFVQQHLSSQSIEALRNFVGGHPLLIIDEAQKINNIGLNLKLMVDHIPGIRIIATGSSAFDLASQVGEPLTGRKYTLRLYPLSQSEITVTESDPSKTQANLETRLIYGSYPEVVLSSNHQTRELYLKEIVNSYLYKDILELDGLKHSDKLVRLLQLIAFQIGKEVSYNELGTQLAMSKNTVDRYLDLLEKAFVIYRLSGFSRNLRKEISKNSRYYFYDNGVRNALINNFNPLHLRDDLGMLWENYIVIERLKKQEYNKIHSNNYFWRTYDQKEIDWIEERGGDLYGYEIKWQKKSEKAPKEWLNTYKNTHYQVIDQSNYLKFIA